MTTVALGEKRRESTALVSSARPRREDTNETTMAAATVATTALIMTLMGEGVDAGAAAPQ